MSTNAPMTAAQAAQNLNRDSGGRYATKIHGEADTFETPTPPRYEAMSEDDYDTRFGNVDNPYDADNSYWELEHIRSALDAGTITEAQVWTAMDADGGGIVGTNGIHHVNAFAYFVSEQPAPDDAIIEVRLQEASLEDLDDEDIEIWEGAEAEGGWEDPENYPEWTDLMDREDVDDFMFAASSVLAAVNEQADDGHDVMMSWNNQDHDFRLELTAPNGLVVTTQTRPIGWELGSSTAGGGGLTRFRRTLDAVRAARANFLTEASTMIK